MDTESTVTTDLPGQNDGPPVNKMDDHVVVVVESGGIECETAEYEVAGDSKQVNGLKERSDLSEEVVCDENSELIKVALAAEQDVLRKTRTDQDNERTDQEGLQYPETKGDRTRLAKNETNSKVSKNSGKNDNGVPDKVDFESSGVADPPDISEVRQMEDGLMGANDGTRGNRHEVPDTGGTSQEKSVNEVNNVAVTADLPVINSKELETEKLEEREMWMKMEGVNEGILQGDADENLQAGRFADYACEECGKRFTHVSSKKRHMLKHKEGESPVLYQCLACSKTFQYNSSLKRHLKLHSEETTGKAYTCKECSKAFMYATSLKRHLKTHSGKEIYPCPHCQRCFEYVSSLRRHEKLHTEGKGFKCDTCSKSFGYLSSLTRHQKVHQKALTCDKCGKEFRLYKSYVKHLEEHGEILGEDELAAMQVDETGEEEESVEEGFSSKDEDGHNSKPENDEAADEVDENAVSASMVVDNVPAENEDNQLDAIQGDVIDLQSAENHPFVKFVVSQNTVTLEQLQSFQAAHAAGSAEGTSSQDPIAYAVVQTDGNAVVGENCMVANNIQELAGNQVGGIVLVELDQNNKVTERHMEGLQASNLLQLLQAVEGFAVENNAQTEKEGQENPSTDEGIEAAMKIQEEAKEKEDK